MLEPMAALSTTAVIFDLDGTLVDSEPAYYEAGRRVLARHGVDGFTWEQHTSFLGVGTRQTLRALKRTYGIAAGVEQLLAEKNRAYLELTAGGAVEVFPRMRDLVERLHTAGCPMAVASGSSREAIAAVLSRTGLSTLLDRFVSAEDVPRGKPDPDVLLAAARLLEVEPARCAVLEDSPPGVVAARRADMRCIAVPYLPAHADDPAFAGAGLVFPGGPDTFDAATAYTWLTTWPTRASRRAARARTDR